MKKTRFKTYAFFFTLIQMSSVYLFAAADDLASLLKVFTIGIQPDIDLDRMLPGVNFEDPGQVQALLEGRQRGEDSLPDKIASPSPSSSSSSAAAAAFEFNEGYIQDWERLMREAAEEKVKNREEFLLEMEKYAEKEYREFMANPSTSILDEDQIRRFLPLITKSIFKKNLEWKFPKSKENRGKCFTYFTSSDAEGAEVKKLKELFGEAGIQFSLKKVKGKEKWCFIIEGVYQPGFDKKLMTARRNLSN